MLHSSDSREENAVKKIRLIASAALTVIYLIAAAPKALSGVEETPLCDYIRLHVVARSDSAWDQGVKLSVRDAVREEAAALLADCKNADEAWWIVQNNLDAFEKAARETLDEWNEPCETSASAGVYAFPDREYDGVLVPAGDYRAVRVTLGDGKGKNWWCVLFPSLCLPAGTDEETPIVFYSSLGRWLARLFGRDAA